MKPTVTTLLSGYLLRGWLTAVFVVFSLLPATAQEPRILAIGDSLMAAHTITGRSVADFLEERLGEEVENRSVGGAHMVYRLPLTGSLGFSIPKQFRGKDDYDWVVMTGGGNDLWLGCGCDRCDRRLNKIVSKNGARGELPRLFQRIQKSGARVIYIGYLRSPGIRTPIEHCKDEGDELEARIARLAARVDGVYYVSLQDLVPFGDTSYFMLDGIHPTVKASDAIAARVAELMHTTIAAERNGTVVAATRSVVTPVD